MSVAFLYFYMKYFPGDYSFVVIFVSVSVSTVGLQ